MRSSFFNIKPGLFLHNPQLICELNKLSSREIFVTSAGSMREFQLLVQIISTRGKKLLKVSDPNTSRHADGKSRFREHICLHKNVEREVSGKEFRCKDTD